MSAKIQVTVNKLNVRPAPTIMNTPLELIKKGEKVSILEHLDGWLKISHKGRVGYIRNLKQYVHIMPKVPVAKKKKNGDNGVDIERFRKKAEDINRKIEKGRDRVRVHPFLQSRSRISPNSILGLRVRGWDLIQNYS